MTAPASLGRPRSRVLDEAEAAAGLTLAHLRETEARAQRLEDLVRARLQGLRERLQELARQEQISKWRLGGPELEAFIERPFLVLPAGSGKYRVIVPRFLDFHLGVLERHEGGYNVFSVDRYARWLGAIPTEFGGFFDFPEGIEATVSGGFVDLAREEDQARAWDRYKNHLTRKEGTRRLRVKGGHEFALISDLIRDGTLPFEAKPVSPDHFRAVPAWSGMGPGAITLRQYQQRGWDEFLRVGAVAYCWPTGAGKTIPPLYAMAHLKGRFLVVVPSRTLVDQWAQRVHRHLAPEARNMVEIVTYQGFDKIRRKTQERGFQAYTLVVFDECHHLPANSFAKLATIPTHYRMGLSATPYREDGRADLIFALAGFPHGADWRELEEAGVIEYPDVFVYACRDPHGKLGKLRELLDRGSRTLVFCDSLQAGGFLSQVLKLPYVSGDSKHRLDIIKQNRQVIVSRVGDEGLSDGLEDLELVVEYDFHAGSRRQQAQRVGRLMHSHAGRGEHWVLMTRDELERHEKRLYALQEKGIDVQILREEGA